MVPRRGGDDGAGGRRATAPWGIARATIASLVEGQETSVLPFKVRGHIDKLWVNREMHQAASKSEERFARIAIRAVLLNSVLNILSRERVLEFGGENR